LGFRRGAVSKNRRFSDLPSQVCHPSKKKLPPSAEDRRLLVEVNHPELSARRQCELVGLNRSSFYYEPTGATPEDLRILRLIDWYSRYVVAWRLSNTLDGGFCLEMLEEALRGGCPEVFNTDQGVQFTAEAFTGRLLSAGVAVSMDGRGRALDNVFVERLWRT